MLDNGYMFLKYVLSQGLGELAAGNDSRNELQAGADPRVCARKRRGWRAEVTPHPCSLSSEESA